MPAAKKVQRENIFLRLHPVQKLIISLSLSIAAYFIIPSKAPSLITITFSWDVFAVCYLILSWVVIIKRSVAQIRKEAKKDDGSLTYVFLLIMLSSFTSLVMVLLLVVSHDGDSEGNGYYLPVAIGGILLSWFMIHSTYTFHYAHIYYDDDDDNPGKDAHGLEFPGNDKLNYIDFAYFAFVIGCTFQVSDVEISSAKIRRVAFIHGLISFFLNTFVVALTINLIAGLSK